MPVSKQLIVDVLVSMIVCLPIVFLQTMGQPRLSGFWCQDKSLNLPYKADTISQYLLLTVAIGLPFLVISATETMRAAVNSQQSLRYRPEMFSLVKAFSVFLLGMFVNVLFTEVAKLTVGRLRPHFLQVCRPTFSELNCSSYLEGPDRYGAETGKMVSEMYPRARKDQCSGFLRKHISTVSFLQLLVCLFLLLLLKLLEISLREILQEQSILMSLLGYKYGLFNSVINRPPTYPTDDKTNTLLDTRDMCGSLADFDALVIVHTAVDHFTHRQRYRDTYGNRNFTWPFRLKIVFFLGLPSDPGLQPDILRENTQDGDTVQGNFTDTYRNLTYKAVMAYRWVSENCRHVKIILKMDDDVILDVHRFFEEFVMPPIYQQEIIFCHIWTLGEVERVGKWGVSLLDYRGDYYPPYCSGFLVVVMPAVVEDLYETAKDTPFLWLDDVYIYGVVRQEMKHVQLVNLDQVAYREEHYRACWRQYGYRCKYWASVLPQGVDFLQMLLGLRAERLRVLAHRRSLQNLPHKRNNDNFTLNSATPLNTTASIPSRSSPIRIVNRSTK